MSKGAKLAAIAVANILGTVIGTVIATLLTLWSLNTLCGLHIAYSVQNIAAAGWLMYYTRVKFGK